MIEEVRKKYNTLFSEEAYNNFTNDLNISSGNRLDFRVCETPLFLNSKLTNELIYACNEVVNQIRTKEFFEKSKNSVPSNLFVPNEDDHPIFLQIDFSITLDSSGNFLPQLIELQGFPSLYAFQAFLEQMVRKHFYVPENFTSYFNGLNFDQYIKLFQSTLIKDSDPQNVILLEIEPEKQKTRIDFFLTQKYTGVKTVCITDIIKKGNKLFYKEDGKEILIERIYNRVIFDELEKKQIKFNFSFHDDLDVTWVGHPNWFYRISKYSLPIIKGKYSPECYYLSELEKYPEDLENYVLKPLFSFAGSGVIVDLTKSNLDKIKDQSNYILQKKVEYAPLIQTPDIKSKAEIRMMYLWNEHPILINNLLRTSKGKMMGVDFNKNQTWIGSNTVFHPQSDF